MVLVLQGPAVFSQEPSESEGNQITFPTLVGTPDLELTLPIHLSISEQVKIGQLSMEVSFPSPQLAFVGMKLFYLAEKVGAQVSVEKLESGSIQVHIAVPENGEKALPRKGWLPWCFGLPRRLSPCPLPL